MTDVSLIFSGIPPVGLAGPHKFHWREYTNFEQIWWKLLEESVSVKIATGYVSADSIVRLTRLLQDDRTPAEFKFDLLVGMAKFEGLSETQLESLETLDQVLEKQGRGRVRVANVWKFHGKVSLFFDSGGCFAAIMGSSNLSGITPGTLQYECDVLFRGSEETKALSEFVAELYENASSLVSDVEIPALRTATLPTAPLQDIADVEQVASAELALIKSLAAISETSYEMPLRAGADVQKSNLNVFFGKGRVNTQRTFERPRPWYEVEIQPTRDWYRSSPLFELANQHFPVVTDDGYRFQCYSSLDQSWGGQKNFRSSDDLQILGRWIKGRLEAADCLKPGERITDEILAKYGRSSILFTRIEDNLWFADFSPNSAPPMSK